MTETAPPNVESALDFLAGGGDLGALMRAFDWSATSLGPPRGWPQSLKTAVRIMLTSRQPIWIGWGEDLVYLYNDAYKSIIGGKHPWALGQPTSAIWGEIWSDVAPMLATAMDGVEGTYVEEQLLIMERNGYPEETYYTFSFSPIPGDDGAAGGIICANTDDTKRVIGARQLALLRDLAAGTVDARTRREVCEQASAVLCSNAHDLPFAMLYVSQPDGKTLALEGACGIEPGHPAAPLFLPVEEPFLWPLAEVIKSQEHRLVLDLKMTGIEFPTGAWAQPPNRAVAMPIHASGETGLAGVLIVGLNPLRLFDEHYRDFLGLVAGQIAAAIANARAYETERRRAEALAEIDRAKTLFFSNVSHEFRTPLTLMLGPLEDLLADATGLPAPERAQVEVAHRNGLRLLKLVNSLLDFSRIEAGRAQASFEPTDLARLTAELASNFRSATEKAGLDLIVECPPLRQPVYVDRDMWEKIVLNLLSNAFKFTFEGAIRVGLKQAGDTVELAVQDTGTGIAERELRRIFERFHRIEGARGRSFEGSGIGLALVQELVKLHGGVIRARSEEGRGSAFTVSIPLGAAHLPSERVHSARSLTSTAPRAHAYVEEALRWLPGAARTDAAIEKELFGSAPSLVHSAHGERASILLAEDNADMRDYVCRLLGTHHDVVPVADGQAALDAARKRRPDLILTDIMMPRLDGFGLLRAIRRDPQLKDLPVIVLSARAGGEASVEGLSAGADDYLVKPFSARELMARIDSALAMARMRRQMTEMLRESEARFRNMADNAPVMIWTTDPTGFCTYVSRSWCEFTGQEPGVALGFGWLEATHPEDARRSEELFLAANERREAFSLEYRLRRRDGVYRWAIDAATPWFGANGAFLGYIGSVIDIEERRQIEEAQRQLNQILEKRIADTIVEREHAEAQLRQAQKMEAVGKLTGGVAHDFNNLLQVIGGNLQILAKDVAGNEKAEQRLSNAVAGVSRGTRLASQLLAFGRRQPLAPKVVNLGRLIRGMDDMFRRALGDGVEIETIVAGGLWNAMVDPSQVESALLNLAINARDAMNAHGRLTLEAGNASLDDAYGARHGIRPGQYVMLAVTDTGSGIAREVMDRVFEPFFTTKPEGQGTGLGLSMAYGFVKQSDGHIKIYSEPGQGTTVRIYLPRVMQDEDVATEVETGPVTGGTETVLVVEDDEDVRQTAVEMLADLGYRVLRARDAQSAFAIVESGVPIDVLFTDVVMPGPMRSPELARKAKERLPNIAVLFTSGYTDNAIVHGGRIDEGVVLLSKPYAREALAWKIRQVLRNAQQESGGSAIGAALRAPEPEASVSSGEPPALRILLVEDETLIRLSTADMLDALGHSVIEAGSARDALAILEEQPVDLLLTDIGLPDLSGVEMAMQARRMRPGLRVVFATGTDMVPGMFGAQELAGAILLRKPYDLKGLAAALFELEQPAP